MPRVPKRKVIEDSSSEGESEQESALGAPEASVEEAERDIFAERRRQRFEERSGRGSQSGYVNSNIRRWKLITLTHVARQGMDPESGLAECIKRLEGLFDCVKIVGVREKHSDGEYHFHFAVESRDARKKTATKKVRGIFPEFGGRMCNVSFHKCWTTMLVYVAKDQADLSEAEFGAEYTREEALMELAAKRSKRMNCVVAIRRHMDAGGDVDGLTRNDDVACSMVTSFSSVARFATAYQQSRTDGESTLDTIRRLGSDDDADGEVAEMLLVAEQVEALRVFVEQLKTGRKPREQQLYCVGPTSTGKTYPFQMLAMVTRCFLPCLENGERAFAGYSDKAHDWIFFNDFHDNCRFQTLSNILEGSPVTLNGYGCQIVKRRNVPCVLTANKEVAYANLDQERVDALKNRLKVVRFHQKFALDAEELQLKDLCAFLVMKFLD
jgi:hypothetical protein